MESQYFSMYVMLTRTAHTLNITGGFLVTSLFRFRLIILSNLYTFNIYHWWERILDRRVRDCPLDYRSMMSLILWRFFFCWGFIRTIGIGKKGAVFPWISEIICVTDKVKVDFYDVDIILLLVIWHSADYFSWKLKLSAWEHNCFEVTGKGWAYKNTLSNNLLLIQSKTSIL